MCFSSLTQRNINEVLGLVLHNTLLYPYNHGNCTGKNTDISMLAVSLQKRRTEETNQSTAQQEAILTYTPTSMIFQYPWVC